MENYDRAIEAAAEALEEHRGPYSASSMLPWAKVAVEAAAPHLEEEHWPRFIERVRAAEGRTKAAEAEVFSLRVVMANWVKRAERAEAEVKRLQAEAAHDYEMYGDPSKLLARAERAEAQTKSNYWAYWVAKEDADRMLDRAERTEAELAAAQEECPHSSHYGEMVRKLRQAEERAERAEAEFFSLRAAMRCIDND